MEERVQQLEANQRGQTIIISRKLEEMKEDLETRDRYRAEDSRKEWKKRTEESMREWKRE